ncbi:hypothetical protein [Saccharopolyspora rosea]|uniref:Uncharacterized protein n=1 Tax=Saccharopolyspora rosea TaxID=524884 RepID=A0ABW3FRK7_9PSEU|nr:hypothetical protein [Saccharopolyspora rosea]
MTPDPDAPTPPTGIPVQGPGEEGEQNLADVIRGEDVGPGSPAVLGEPQERAGDGPGEWPTLRYRSRDKPERPRRSALDWFRRS